MHIKDNSTEKLIKTSKKVNEEITKEILETFGIDLSTQEITHHDKTKPVWTQQIQDNPSLKNELDTFLNLVKSNLELLPEMIQFEKEHPSTIVGFHSREYIGYDLEFLWICESHVEKFERENYLTGKEISKYHAKIQELRNKIREITIIESL